MAKIKKQNKVKEIFFHQTNDTDFNVYDIIESGGSVVAKSVKGEFVEIIVKALNENIKYYE